MPDDPIDELRGLHDRTIAQFKCSGDKGGRLPVGAGRRAVSHQFDPPQGSYPARDHRGHEEDHPRTERVVTAVRHGCAADASR